MQLAALSTVSNRIQLGAPLPFNVRDADRTLLLARGQSVDSAEQMEALFRRGALVDMAELLSAHETIMQAPREQLPKLWTQCLQRVGQALLASPRVGFRIALDEAAGPVMSLIDRDPDLAIFQILRKTGNADLAYGTQRSLHTAITASLVAHRLAWSEDETQRAFKAGLTANLSMLQLQGELSHQALPPSPEQHHALQTHPMRSVQMLQTAGIEDEDWLQAVLDHHEVEGGGGYPAGKSDVGAMASLIRRADIYTAKLAGRSHRNALAADVAGRQMFMQDPGHPMTAALVKEFGLYPPGCHVRLASGALAIVVQRGARVDSPIVACLTNERGAPLPQPLRVDTADKRHAVAGLVGEKSVNVSVTAERLMALGVVAG